MKAAQKDVEKKRPWKRTMSDIRKTATAIEAYAIDHEERYPNTDYAGLKALLTPTYLASFPEEDVWGHGYAYAATPDGLSYRIISGGADGNFEWDSRRIVVREDAEEYDVRYRERLEDDLILENGSFLQLPVQAKPREE